MKEVNMLKKNFTSLFPWNQARIDFLAKFILALLDAQTINLTRIAQKFPGKAKVDTHYKRIQRFLKGFPICFDCFARVIVKLMNFGDKWVLSMDRTNWKFGKLNINILVLGVVHKGICFPLFWVLLPKRGCSNTQERIDLIKRFLAVFCLENIETLTADREFIGCEWIAYLLETRVPFRIRIRKNTQVASKRSHQVMNVSRLFCGVRLGDTMVLNSKRKVWGHRLHLVGLRAADGYVILITNHKPHTAMTDYKKRWAIETLFCCLKSRGFHFEDIHLTEPDRISKLLALMTLALCWCFLQGVALTQVKAIPVKKHGRLAKSVFRVGLDSLTNILANISYKFRAFKKALQLLSCT